MKTFAGLYRRLDAATATSHKLAAIKDYLTAVVADKSRHAPAAWAVYFLAGGKPRQMAPTRILRRLALEMTGLPEWLVEECYQMVGDLAETLALLLPAPTAPLEDIPLDAWMNVRLAPLRAESDDARLAHLRLWLAAMPEDQRLVFFKLITGSLRVGVSRLNVVNALAAVTGVDTKDMAQRMMGYTSSGRAPRAGDFRALISAEGAAGGEDLRPFPFFLAHPLQAPLADMPELLGPPPDWLVEWKFDGIRAQFVRRGGQWRLWSRGEELIDDAFPEFALLADWTAPGTALDGELVVVAPSDEASSTPARIDDIAPFASMQKRIGRKILTQRLLRDIPAAFIAYDLLEIDGADLRDEPQAVRREKLERFVTSATQRAGAVGVRLPLRISPLIDGADWSELAAKREGARAIGAEGMMLKPRGARYGVGRRKGEARAHWWKWKLDPMSVDAVMIYAQRGSGRRSGVYSDYTFAVWDGEGEARVLVPFAKAYSGLTDAEMREVDGVIRKTTRENYGPVRSLEPTMVFELGFEGISASTRHKSGVAVRFPRMLRWRKDKGIEDADTLESLRGLLAVG